MKCIIIMAVMNPHAQYAPENCQRGRDRNDWLQCSASRGPRTVCARDAVWLSAEDAASPSGSSPTSLGSSRRKKARGKASISTRAPRATQVNRQLVRSTKYAAKGTSTMAPREDPAMESASAVARWRRNHLAMIQLVGPREPPLLKMDITTP